MLKKLNKIKMIIEQILNIIQDDVTIEIDKKHKLAIYKMFSGMEGILTLDLGNDEIDLKDYTVDELLFENGKIKFKYI